MAPFVSGGLTLGSEIPCQLAPTTGAPGMDGGCTAGRALAAFPVTAWLFRSGRPLTPEWPAAAPAATGPTSPPASAAPARVNNRRFFLTEPPSGQDLPDHGRRPQERPCCMRATLLGTRLKQQLDFSRGGASSHIRGENGNGLSDRFRPIPAGGPKVTQESKGDVRGWAAQPEGN